MGIERSFWYHSRSESVRHVGALVLPDGSYRKFDFNRPISDSVRNALPRAVGCVWMCTIATGMWAAEFQVGGRSYLATDLCHSLREAVQVVIHEVNKE
jgi:hypothetical protein